jgi:uncharacterized protein (DUF58 family)
LQCHDKKSEIRNPNAERNPNPESRISRDQIRKASGLDFRCSFGFRSLLFGFLSAFGHRPSALPRMIVPQSRLLFWFALVVLPFTALSAVFPEAWPVVLVALAALAVLAALDLALGAGSLDGITVTLPEVTRFSKDREGAVEVRVRNEPQKPRRLRLGLVWPPGITTPTPEQQVFLPAGTEWSRLEWRATPTRRGAYRMSSICLETQSPVGLWGLRATRPVQAELRVYPNLLAERKNLAALFLNRGVFGVHAQRQIGKGREFEKLREYIPGDSFDDIHWKATAKRGRPVTKVFQLERTQEVYVVVDASRLSARAAASPSKPRAAGPGQLAQKPAGPSGAILAPAPGTEAVEATEPEAGPGASVLERYITAALVLGLAAEQQGDLFGLVAFGDKIESFVRAKNGKAHYSQCRDAIFTLEPRLVTPDFDEATTFIRLRLRRRALLVFLTALDDPALAESFVRNMGLLSRQHLVLVNMLKPPAAQPLFTGDPPQSVDDLYVRLGGHLQWHNLRELGQTLQRRGVRFTLLENESLCLQLVSQYLNIKQRQLL